MAEAVRPSRQAKENKSKNDVQEEEEDEVNASGQREINDANLQQRLKSLTSFINNLEPTAPTADNQDVQQPVASAPPPPLEEPSSSAYYDMVSEQARSRHVESSSFSSLAKNLNEIKPSAPVAMVTSSSTTMTPPLVETGQARTQPPAVQAAPFVRPPTTMDYNLEKINQMNKLAYPRLSWNRTVVLSTSNLTQTIDALVDEELTRFFEQDQLCKELEIYFKSKIVQTEQYEAAVNDFVSNHSMLNEYNYSQVQKKHEFFELLRDYYEARSLVCKCMRYVNAFKWECIANQMRKIWSFEKYTIESFGQCGDQQRVKHELTSEKAYFNKAHLDKLQTMLYELRFNLVKCGLVSSQFCSKLARSKLESYLHDFLIQLMRSNEKSAPPSADKSPPTPPREQLSFEAYSSLNSELRVLIDILFHFHRRQNKPSMSSKVKTVTSPSLAEGEGPAAAAAASRPKTDDQQQYDNELIVDQLGENYEQQSNAFSTSLDDETDETIIQNDQVFKRDVQEWLKVLISLLLYNTERQRRLSLINLNSKSTPMATKSRQSPSQSQANGTSASTTLSYQWANLHFDNIFFCLEHLLRSPDSYISSVSFLFQYPLLLFTDNQPGQEEGSFGHHGSTSQAAVVSFMHQLNFNSSQSDPLVNFYLDFYLKLFAIFAHDVKQRKQFLFLSSSASVSSDPDTTGQHSFSLGLGDGAPSSSSGGANWQLVDLDGDLESLEQMLVEISEDDLVKLYYQIPVNALLDFLWQYLKFQNTDSSFSSSSKSSPGGLQQDGAEFRKRYVALKVISFLDHLAKLCIRTLFVYNRAKYKNFSKLIGRTLKNCVRFSALVCGHMSAEMTTNAKSSDMSKPQMTSMAQSKNEFQMHYDHFVKRLFTTIIYSTRMRSMRWTILSQLDIGSLCLRTKWILLSIMTGIDVYHSNFVDLFNTDLLTTGASGGQRAGSTTVRSSTRANSIPAVSTNTPKDYILQACNNDLESLLSPSHQESVSDGQKLTEIELLSFLKTLHFLVVAQSKSGADDQSRAGLMDDDTYGWTELDELESSQPTLPTSSPEEEESLDFMICVVKVLFRIAYCFESTRELCQKEGNALFFAICSAHPEAHRRRLERNQWSTDGRWQECALFEQRAAVQQMAQLHQLSERPLLSQKVSPFQCHQLGALSTRHELHRQLGL